MRTVFELVKVICDSGCRSCNDCCILWCTIRLVFLCTPRSRKGDDIPEPPGKWPCTGRLLCLPASRILDNPPMHVLLSLIDRVRSGSIAVHRYHAWNQMRPRVYGSCDTLEGLRSWVGRKDLVSEKLAWTRSGYGSAWPEHCDDSCCRAPLFWDQDFVSP